ncbi:MAG: hypothetical protein FWG18_01535 [Alphaproteobacteria bacterium]|nr:hypothetical protein [Alphaproteobacteria bacterium]
MVRLPPPPKKNALISVTDKTGLETFASQLVDLNYNILSSGGTAEYLRGFNIPVTDVALYTKSPEFPGGLVKTLHPKIYAGILHDRTNPEHVAALKKMRAKPINMVVVNLYQFGKAALEIPKPAADERIAAKITNNHDIGGPCMLNAAAKRHGDVWVVTYAEDYDTVIKALKNNPDDYALRRKLAGKAENYLGVYHGSIGAYYSTETFPMHMAIPLERIYNPQDADTAIYQTVGMKKKQVLTMYGNQAGIGQLTQ